MKKNYSRFDVILLFLTLTLLGFGILMVYSASAIIAETRFGDHTLFLKKQFLWAILGLVMFYLSSRIDCHFWQKYSRLLVLLTAILLILVLFIGKSVGGAQRWLRFGFLNFQPSELAKIVTIIFFADYFDRKRSKVNNFKKGLLVPYLLLGLLCALILLQPDFGTSIFIGLLGIVMFFLSGVKIKYLLGPTFLGLVFCVFAVHHKSYRWVRILSFFQSFIDFEKASYQTKQALYALGSGGIKGVGLGRGHLKLLYLPEAHTDFIFPIIGEELGLLGTLGVIFLFIIFAWRGWRVSLRAPTFFSHLLSAGITFYIFSQALVNIGVSCGYLPTKGLPLPFISFGGSSLLCSLFAVGVLLNISRQTKESISYKRY